MKQCNTYCLDNASDLTDWTALGLIVLLTVALATTGALLVQWCRKPVPPRLPAQTPAQVPQPAPKMPTQQEQPQQRQPHNLDLDQTEVLFIITPYYGDGFYYLNSHYLN
jgi:hypothetical protein